MRLSRNDNVAVCLGPVAAASKVALEDFDVVALDDIPGGHKIALRAIAAGENVVKYGEVIGRATTPIPAGAHVHVHNVGGVRARGDLAPEHVS